MSTIDGILVDRVAGCIFISPYQLENLQRVMMGHNKNSSSKIEAIKWIRARSDLGLREAKEFVENLGLTMKTQLGAAWIHSDFKPDALKLGSGVLMSHTTEKNAVLLFKAGTACIDIVTNTINIPTGITLDEMQTCISWAKSTIGSTLSNLTTIHLL